MGGAVFTLFRRFRREEHCGRTVSDTCKLLWCSIGVTCVIGGGHATRGEIGGTKTVVFV